MGMESIYIQMETNILVNGLMTGKMDRVRKDLKMGLFTLATLKMG